MKRWLFALLLGIVLVVTAVIGHALHQRSWLHPRDDQMYLLALAVRYIDPPRFAAVAKEASDFVRARAESPWLVIRYDLRDRYSNNYAGISYLTYLVGRILQSPVPADTNSYSRWVAQTMSVSAAVASSLALIVLLIALLMARDLRLLAAAAIFGVITLYEGMIDVSVSDRLLPAEPGVVPNPLDVLNRVVRLIIDPGDSTYPFGAVPRCAFSLLLLAVFVFRWQGRPAFGYWLFLPLTLIHQSMAGLFLAMVVALDLFLRPRTLAKPGVFLAIGTAIAVFLVRERIWLVVGIAAPVVLVIVMALGLVVVLVLRRRFPHWDTSLLRKAQRSGSWLQRRSPPVADALLLAAGWFVLLVLTAIGNYFAAPEQSAFFWNHIAGRVLGTFRPEILIAICYAVLGRFGRRVEAQRWAMPAAALLALLVLPPAVAAWPPTVFPSVVERNITALNGINAQLATPPMKVTGAEEALIYYWIGKSVVIGRDAVPELR
jgi:hypothetical protein